MFLGFRTSLGNICKLTISDFKESFMKVIRYFGCSKFCITWKVWFIYIDNITLTWLGIDDKLRIIISQGMKMFVLALFTLLLFIPKLDGWAIVMHQFLFFILTYDQSNSSGKCQVISGYCFLSLCVWYLL